MVVTLVSSDYPAESLGIQVEDVITHYDGETVTDFMRFIARREAEARDDPARELRIRRGDEALSIMVNPGTIGIGLQGRAVARDVARRAATTVTAGRAESRMQD